MKLFLDSEFTDLNRLGALISLALVHNEETYLYAELTDAWPARLEQLSLSNVGQVDWIRKNVLGALLLQHEPEPFISNRSGKIYLRGTRSFIRSEVEAFLGRFDAVEIVCDVGHFDMMHFIDLFGDAISDFPAHVAPAYWDFNQELATRRKWSIDRAFQWSRGNGHNALDDALRLYRQWNELLEI